MIQIRPDDPMRDVLPFVKDWIKLLADGQIDEACALLDEPNHYGMVWMPDMIIDAITGVPHTDSPPNEGLHIPDFTDPYELGEQNDIYVGEFADGTGYYFDYSVPINHEWSDFTAQFEFYERKDNYAVVLHDIHVL